MSFKYDPNRRLTLGESQDPYRSSGQRDRDRILYAKAFRRLGGTTQVASANESHRFHNRLTHTLEVAQIASRLSDQLRKDTESTLVKKVGGIDADVAEAAAIGHDLGHPPFGHVGEQELDRLVTDCKSEKGHSDGYEGNAQAFRIVTRLATRHEKIRGLNLTCATLNALIKYPNARAPDGKEHDKYGFYFTEKEYFEDIRQGLSDTKQRTIEAEIMDWADEIAYAVSDLYDFARAGVIPLDRLISSENAFAVFVDKVRERWDKHSFQKPYLRDDLLSVWRLFQGAPILGQFENTFEDRARLRSFATSLIRRYCHAIQVVDPKKNGGKCVSINPEAKMEVDIFKELNWIYVIENPALKGIQHGARQIIKELFEICYNNGQLATDLLPKWAMQLHAEGSPPHRIVADVISGLTEDQAVSLHQRLTGQHLGSMLDPIMT